MQPLASTFVLSPFVFVVVTFVVVAFVVVVNVFLVCFISLCFKAAALFFLLFFHTEELSHLLYDTTTDIEL